MTRKKGLLVVNRLALLRVAQRSKGWSSRRPPREGPDEEVFRTYRGFDGLVWPVAHHAAFEIRDGLASPGDLTAVNDYLNALACATECEVILLSRGEEQQPIAVFEGEWWFAGFDLGYFESEFSHFSVVLHDVLYGNFTEMRRFAKDLNEQFLIPTVDMARALVSQRAILEADGADLEEIKNLEMIPVYLRSFEPGATGPRAGVAASEKAREGDEIVAI